MFVAYLIPKYDTYLLIEDGLGYVAKGETAKEAEAAVFAQLREACEGDEGVEEIISDHVCHVTEL
jgi:hypothetical protein